MDDDRLINNIRVGSAEIPIYIGTSTTFFTIGGSPQKMELLTRLRIAPGSIHLS